MQTKTNDFFGANPKAAIEMFSFKKSKTIGCVLVVQGGNSLGVYQGFIESLQKGSADVLGDGREVQGEAWEGERKGVDFESLQKYYRTQ